LFENWKLFRFSWFRIEKIFDLSFNFVLIKTRDSISLKFFKTSFSTTQFSKERFIFALDFMLSTFKLFNILDDLIVIDLQSKSYNKSKLIKLLVIV